jgi:hypothetical protein
VTGVVKGEERGWEGKETYNTLGTLNLSIEIDIASDWCVQMDRFGGVFGVWVGGGREGSLFRKGREMVGRWMVDGREGEGPG